MSTEEQRTPRRHHHNGRRHHHWKRGSGRRHNGAGSPSCVQDTNRKWRRTRHRAQHAAPPAPHHDQHPYHVFDVFGTRGLFLIDGTVPVESLAAMGLVLPVPWMHDDHYHLMLRHHPIHEHYTPPAFLHAPGFVYQN